MSSKHKSTLGEERGSEPLRKRTRINRHEDDFQFVCEEMPSMESLLAVPPEILYRCVGPEDNPRPLLTGAEAECFLKVALLAQELDGLLELLGVVLNQQRFCRIHNARLQKSKHPLLIPISVVVSLMSKQARPELQYITGRLTELLSDLSSNASILRLSAEQNRTLCDSLVDALNMIEASSSLGQTLLTEKRTLAKLEEELATRIDYIAASRSSEICAQLILQLERRAACSGDSACSNLFPDIRYRDVFQVNTKNSRNTESIADLAFHFFRVQNESDKAHQTSPFIPSQSLTVANCKIRETDNSVPEDALRISNTLSGRRLG